MFLPRPGSGLPDSEAMCKSNDRSLYFLQETYGIDSRYGKSSRKAHILSSSPHSSWRVCRTICSTKWCMFLTGSPCLGDECCLFSSVRFLVLRCLLPLDFVLRTELTVNEIQGTWNRVRWLSGLKSLGDTCCNMTFGRPGTFSILAYNVLWIKKWWKIMLKMVIIYYIIIII